MRDLAPDLEDFMDTDFDSAALRRAYSCFPSGVSALTAICDGRPICIVASSLTSVSLDPPLLGVCMTTGSKRWQLLRHAPTLGVSFLSSRHTRICRQLAGPTDVQFDGVDWQAAESGAVFIAGAAAQFECEIHSVQSGGDHEFVLLAVRKLSADPTIDPLVFHASRFHSLAPAQRP